MRFDQAGADDTRCYTGPADPPALATYVLSTPSPPGGTAEPVFQHVSRRLVAIATEAGTNAICVTRREAVDPR